MEVSDVINIVLAILSFILALISVVTVVATLKQNNRMIENNNRPYIVCYSSYTYFQDLFYYVVVKNYGQTGAIVTDFKCNIDLKEYCKNKEREPFGHIINTFIAPQQSYIACLNSVKLFEDNIKEIKFNIEYLANNKKYKENYIINFMADTDMPVYRACTEGKELRNISYTLQDMVEKML